MDKLVTVTGVVVDHDASNMVFFSFKDKTSGGGEKFAYVSANRLWINGERCHFSAANADDDGLRDRFRAFFERHLNWKTLRADVLPLDFSGERFPTTSGMNIRPDCFSMCAWTGDRAPSDEERLRCVKLVNEVSSKQGRILFKDASKPCIISFKHLGRDHIAYFTRHVFFIDGVLADGESFQRWTKGKMDFDVTFDAVRQPSGEDFLKNIMPTVKVLWRCLSVWVGNEPNPTLKSKNELLNVHRDMSKNEDDIEVVQEVRSQRQSTEYLADKQTRRQDSFFEREENRQRSTSSDMELSPARIPHVGSYEYSPPRSHDQSSRSESATLSTPRHERPRADSHGQRNRSYERSPALELTLQNTPRTPSPQRRSGSTAQKPRSETVSTPSTMPIMMNPILTQAKNILSRVIKCSSPDDEDVNNVLGDEGDVQLAMFLAKTLNRALSRYSEKRNGGSSTSSGPELLQFERILMGLPESGANHSASSAQRSSRSPDMSHRQPLEAPINRQSAWDAAPPTGGQSANRNAPQDGRHHPSTQHYAASSSSWDQLPSTYGKRNHSQVETDPSSNKRRSEGVINYITIEDD